MKALSRPWFTVGFCLVYPLVFAMDWPLFVYFPQVQRLHWGSTAHDIGPGMHWYGLVATSALAGLVLGVVCRSSWLGPRVTRWLWLAPVFAMLGAVVLLRHFFV